MFEDIAIERFAEGLSKANEADPEQIDGYWELSAIPALEWRDIFYRKQRTGQFVRVFSEQGEKDYILSTFAPKVRDTREKQLRTDIEEVNETYRQSLAALDELGTDIEEVNETYRLRMAAQAKETAAQIERKILISDRMVAREGQAKETAAAVERKRAIREETE